MASPQFLAVVLALSLVGASGAELRRHGAARLHRGAPAAAVAASPGAAPAPAPAAPVEPQFPRVPSVMHNLLDKCQCKFKDICSCDGAMEYMDCLADACDSGRCDCHELECHRGCVSMAQTCQGLDFECSSSKAVCTTYSNMTDPELAASINRMSEKELRDDLIVMRGKKCELEEAMRNGWVNADNQLAKLVPRIARRRQALEERDVEVVSLNCEKAVKAAKVEPVAVKK